MACDEDNQEQSTSRMIEYIVNMPAKENAQQKLIADAMKASKEEGKLREEDGAKDDNLMIYLS